MTNFSNVHEMAAWKQIQHGLRVIFKPLIILINIYQKSMAFEPRSVSLNMSLNLA